MYGLDDEKRTKLTATLFNGRKLCGVFTPGPGGAEVPPVWIDRAGAKVAVTEQYSRQSRGTLALVAQASAGRDAARGAGPLPVPWLLQRLALRPQRLPAGFRLAASGARSRRAHLCAPGCLATRLACARAPRLQQEVTARDETGALCPRGLSATPFGQYNADGPPTTLSESGRDRLVYAQVGWLEGPGGEG